MTNLTKRPALIVIIIAYASFMAIGLWDGLLGVAWPSMQTTFSLPIDAVGLLLLAATAGHITASFSNGRFLRLTGISTLLIIALSLRGGAFVGQSISPSWYLIVAFAFINGLGAGMLDSGMNTYAASRFRPRLLNWLHASFAVGASLGSLLMTALLDAELSWRTGFGILAAINIILALAFILTRKRWTLPHQDRTHDAPTQSQVSAWDTLKLPIVWISILIFLLYTGTELGLGQWAFTLATKSRDIPESTAGIWTSLYWGGLTAGRIILGFIETNTERLVRLALILVVIGALLFALNLLPFINLLGLMMIGFGLAPVFPALIALTPHRIGVEHAPNAIGFQVGAAGLGGAILPGLAGVLGDSFGLEWIAIFFLVSAVLLFATQEVAARAARSH